MKAPPSGAIPDHADVLVIGGGGSGLAAAIEAAEQGGRVVLLEKNPRLGGTTVRSVGAFSASNSMLQRRDGIRDSPDLQFEDMQRLSGANTGRDNLALRRLLVDHSGEALDWLIDHGLRFYGPLPDDGMNSVPRMCTVLPSSSAYARQLGRAARRVGVSVVTDFRVAELLRDGDRILGVSGTHGGRRYEIRSVAVILAAGDFSASPELKRQLAGEALSKIEALNPTSTGDGIRLGLSVGGRVLNGDLEKPPRLWLGFPRRSLTRSIPAAVPITSSLSFVLRALPTTVMDLFVTAMATKFLALSPELFRHGAVLVNQRGERFMDETTQDWQRVAEQPAGAAYVIFDGRAARHFNTRPNFVASNGAVGTTQLRDYRRFRPGLCHRARTIDGLARTIGASAASVEQALVRNGPGLPTGPYYALGPVGARLTAGNAGLAIDENLQVLRGETSIEGLYAIGANGQGGMLLQGLGVHIGWAFVSGRLAAQHAMASVRLVRSHSQ